MLRVKGANYVWQIVMWIKGKQTLVASWDSGDGADPRGTLHGSALALLKPTNNGPWALRKNEFMYVATLLSYHIDVVFEKANQTVNMIGMQIVKAMVVAVTSSGQGQLFDRLRPWDVCLQDEDMVWDADLLEDYSAV